MSQGKTKAEESEEYSFYNCINMRGGGKHFRPFLSCKIQVFVLFLYCIALHPL